MLLNNSKIGIWGLGVVGTAVLNFLRTQNVQLSIIEPNLSEEQKVFYEQQNIAVWDQKNIQDFFEYNDYVIPSPGIDCDKFKINKNKLYAELDLFAENFKKPYIAITGTLGKTTVTTLLSTALTYNKNGIFTGGNIGIGCCEALKTQDQHDFAVLEVSSFQLEYCKEFAPDVAIWTNFYPNHLDRHITQDNYFAAKLQLLRNQKPGQKAIVPITLADQLQQHTLASTIYYVATEKPTLEQLQKVSKASAAYWIEDNAVVYNYNNKQTAIFQIPAQHNHFQENLVVTAAALHILGQETTGILSTQVAFEHRKEFIATINGVDFYNDSKATVPQATLAALAALPHKQTILILGGLSKGVDRKSLIEQLPSHVCHIICFGKEKELLAAYCAAYNKTYSCYDNLEECFTASVRLSQPDMQVVFSPAGASFDLFGNYKLRGECFKKLVQEIQAHL